VVILTLDTTTRAGSCALWRGGDIVDERVGNPEHTHAHRLPNDLAKLLASHRLRLKDVTLYAIASGPGSFTGLRVGIATMQALALVHDRLIVPISSLEALAYCAAREDPTRARPGTYIGAWMEAYRGELFCALYRVMVAPTLIESSHSSAIASSDSAAIESSDSIRDRSTPEHAPRPATPPPVSPVKTRMSLAVLEQVAEPAVGTPDALIEAWLSLIDPQAPILLIGDAVHAHRPTLLSRFPRASLLDHVPIAGMLAELAAREPERGVMPHAVVPLYLRRPLAELARERLEQQRHARVAAAEPPPAWHRQGSGNASRNGSGNGLHKAVE
jgi:tRNA threonylcarbamoyl adenosine modification protein YeaZ